MSRFRTPFQKLDTVTIYVDETYLHRHTGVIKSALVIADSIREPFEQAMAPLLAVHQAPEFKAGKISVGNLPRYREFLRFIVNVIAETGIQSPLRTIVTIESMDIYRSKLFAAVKKIFDDGLARYGAETMLATDMTGVTVWCGGHLKCIVPDGAANPLAVVLDESHRNDRLAAEEKWMTSPTLGFATPIAVKKLLPGMLMVGLDLIRSNPKSPVPRVKVVEVDFVRSQNSVYLQAADLLANLTFNYLQVKKGVRTDSAQMKHDLLASVMNDGGPSAELLGWLQIIDDDGAPKMVGAEGLFASRVSLDPSK